MDLCGLSLVFVGLSLVHSARHVRPRPNHASTGDWDCSCGFVLRATDTTDKMGDRPFHSDHALCAKDHCRNNQGLSLSLSLSFFVSCLGSFLSPSVSSWSFFCFIAFPLLVWCVVGVAWWRDMSYRVVLCRVVSCRVLLVLLSRLVLSCPIKSTQSIGFSVRDPKLNHGNQVAHKRREIRWLLRCCPFFCTASYMREQPLLTLEKRPAWEPLSTLQIRLLLLRLQSRINALQQSLLLLEESRACFDTQGVEFEFHSCFFVSQWRVFSYM